MMKKYLFITLMLFSFLSCTSDKDEDEYTGGETTLVFDDWNNPKSPNYKPNGYNPIEGEWLRKNSKTYKIIFTSKFEFQESYYEDGEWKYIKTFSTYKINNTTFKTDQEIPYSQDKIDTFPYRLGKDEKGEFIIITYPLGEMRYSRLK